MTMTRTKRVDLALEELMPSVVVVAKAVPMAAMGKAERVNAEAYFAAETIIDT